MKVDAVCAQPHYLDHVLPIWDALPETNRGDLICWHKARAAAQRLGLPHMTEVTESDRLTIVASVKDAKRAAAAGRPLAYTDHGTGQPFRDTQGRIIPEGVGEPRPEAAVILTGGPFITWVKHQINGPTANIVMTGSARVERLRQVPRPSEPLIVFSTHWDHTIAPEARGCMGTYWAAIKRLAKRYPVAVHAHPRTDGKWKREAQRAGLEFIDHFDDVVRRATLYAVDESSTLFEFAALDRPVLVLNAPWYRRDHHHGLRFWEASTVGVNVDTPAELEAKLQLALEDPPEQRRLRREAIAYAYREFDGLAAERAVAAILDTARLLQAA